jgi:hypothetical protein
MQTPPPYMYANFRQCLRNTGTPHMICGLYLGDPRRIRERVAWHRFIETLDTHLSCGFFLAFPFGSETLDTHYFCRFFLGKLWTPI